MDAANNANATNVPINGMEIGCCWFIKRSTIKSYVLSVDACTSVCFAIRARLDSSEVESLPTTGLETRSFTFSAAGSVDDMISDYIA